ncbi:MAG: tol-pal system protein YbgF, partial [Alphaproteobacteria bacterium]|nr:tol-pal system protein YbgF [Alphaproteobacteria bacterium]
KQELSTTGAAGGVEGDTVLQRLDALEGELRRITGKTEELEFRIDNIVRDGTNRIGDLEFRLVELEGGDVSTLGETSTLGGDLTQTPPPLVVTPPEDGSDLAVSEEVDFDAAKTAYDEGDLESAASLFTGFIEDYPGGPLTADAQYWRGEALAGLGEWSSAARAFLQSFSSGPENDLAPQALYRLGVSLDKIGQTEEACLTLNEVNVRYPGVDAAARAEGTMASLGCAG